MLKIGEYTIENTEEGIWFRHESGEGFGMHDQKFCNHEHADNPLEEFLKLIKDFYEKTM